MTKRITHIAKPLLPATLTLSALLSMAACGSDAAKPSASAAPTTNTAAVAAPAPNQPGNAPGGAGTATAPTTGARAERPTSTQPQTPAAKDAKPAAKPSTANANANANSGSSVPSDCTTANLKGTVSGLTNPINHVLLTVTNTGTTTCNLYYFPDLRLDADQQSVTRAIEDSKPQAVVTIAPGESAYASIGTSAGDGSGTPQLEKQVEVFLETRDQTGSLPGSLKLPLPAGTYVDLDKAFVTYWQSDLQSAIAW